jgi:hypothetical protein
VPYEGALREPTRRKHVLERDAVVGVPGEAPGAAAAGAQEPAGDPVSYSEVLDPLAYGAHHAAELVPEVSDRIRVLLSPEHGQVAAAHPASGDLDDHRTLPRGHLLGLDRRYESGLACRKYSQVSLLRFSAFDWKFTQDDLRDLLTRIDLAADTDPQAYFAASIFSPSSTVGSSWATVARWVLLPVSGSVK